MSPLLNSVLSHPRLNHALSRLLGGYISIFTLHRTVPASGAFNGTSPELLKACLSYAQQQGYAFASIDELVELAQQGGRLTRPTLCFTLDDGYADQLQQLVPVFLNFQAKPTFFVLTDLVDGTDWPWDAKLSYCVWRSDAKLTAFNFEHLTLPVDLATVATKIETRRKIVQGAKTLPPSQQEAYLAAASQQFQVDIPKLPPSDYLPTSWHSLRAYEAMGLRIGCHGKNHRVLTALSEPGVLAELLAANSRLQLECHNPSKVFCYPSGAVTDFSPQHFDLVKQVGFSSAVTTLPRITHLKHIQQNPYAIHRLSMPNNIATFKRNCAWFDYLRG